MQILFWQLSRRKGTERLHAFFVHQLFDGAEKGDVPVRAHQRCTEWRIFGENGKGAVQKLKKFIRSQIGGEFFVHGIRKLFQKPLFRLLQQVVNVGVVQIKGGAVDVHQICQLPHRDLLDALLL